MAGALASTLNKLAQNDDMFSMPKGASDAFGSKKEPTFGTPSASLSQKLSDVTKPMASSTAKLPGMTPSFGSSLAGANLATAFSSNDRAPKSMFGQSGGMKPFAPAWASGGGGNDANGSSLNRMLRGYTVQPQVASSGSSSGGMASLGGKWGNVDKLNSYIQAAAQKTGVDPNLIKAVMKLESNGEWIISHAGAVGFMQVVPKYWGHLGYDLYDPAENIMAGATVLKHYLNQSGGNVYDALRHYHGIGFDGFTTDKQYADVIMGNLQELQAAGGGTAGYTGQGSGWSVMFGGTEPNITQEMGLNSWSRQHLNGMYAYAPSYGIQGHAGIDVGLTYGSSVFAPTGGKVVRAGGSGYYCDDSGCGPGQGELRIELDNGDQLIIGHMSNISLQVGQRVNPGMFVGRSGSAGSGAHVHIEYRTRDSSTASGWRVLDPRQALGGMVTATGGGGVQQQGGNLQSWVLRSFGIR